MMSGRSLKTMPIRLFQRMSGSGCVERPSTDVRKRPGDVKEEGLFDEDECVRINTAYALANDRTSIPLLVDAMRRETLAAIEDTTAKTADNAHGTNPTPGAAARALSTMGAAAIHPLLEALEDDHWWVRAMAADVLARMGPAARAAVFILVEKVGDDHWWVRRNALEALRSIGAVSRGCAACCFRGGKGPRLPRSAECGAGALQRRRGRGPGGG